MPFIKYEKNEILFFFREHCDKIIRDSELQKYQVKRQVEIIRNSLYTATDELISHIPKDISLQNSIELNLLVNYCFFITAIEYRHKVWKYDYLSFSRRIGELWEHFCKIPFYNPINNIKLSEPISFTSLKEKREIEYKQLINNLSDDIKESLWNEYQLTWDIITAGNINLNLDLHLQKESEKVVIDFKSGFGSNEKGNMNRLQTVAKLYHSLNDNFRCLILVRDSKVNNYYYHLVKSKLWECYLGTEAYQVMQDLSGFDLKGWIQNNIQWSVDLDNSTYQYLKAQDCSKYLEW